MRLLSRIRSAVTSRTSALRLVTTRPCRHLSTKTREFAPNQPSATIFKGSTCGVELDFDTTNSRKTRVHAAWLWVNDPKHVQKGSGQKTETSLSFYGRQARIVTACWIQPSRSGHDEVIPPPPPIGSLHSIANMYAGPVASDSDESRWVLKVKWQARNLLTGDMDDWISFYDGNWLAQCFPSHSMEKIHRDDSSSALSAGDDVVQLEYESVVRSASSEPLAQLLDAIVQTGAAIVTNTDNPTDGGDDNESPVALLGRQLSGGGLSHGYLYDDVFHVRTVADAINIAYTSVALPPHQDLAYYESPPGLQLLHCVKNHNVTGGASTLIDGLEAARYLRDVAPTLFAALTFHPATFIKQREEADMVYRRPHIRLGSDDMTIVSVHWSPPFEGPLMGVDDNAMGEYYLAYAAFTRLLDKSQPRHTRLLPQLAESVEARLCDYAHAMTWEYQLQPGEVLVFNNQRMLHGRKAFDASSGQRHLMGCYTNIDESLSQHRRLRRVHGNPAAAIPFVGNGSAY